MTCGKAKSAVPGRAIDVYTGPNFRIVKNYLKANNGLDVKIISAKYGLIDYKDKIIPYELKLTEESAKVYELAFRYFASKRSELYRDIFIVGGKEDQSVFPQIPIKERAVGTNGKQGSQLKKWLYQDKEILQRTL
jgi:hypothetical protein